MSKTGIFMNLLMYQVYLAVFIFKIINIDSSILKKLIVIGLIVIENPFTTEGQQKWIIKCLKDYPRKPNILNIDAHGLLNNDKIWWDVCFG